MLCPSLSSAAEAIEKSHLFLNLADDTMKGAQEGKGKAALVGLVCSAAVSLYSLQVNLTFSWTETTLIPHLEPVLDYGKMFNFKHHLTSRDTLNQQHHFTIFTQKYINGGDLGGDSD